MLFCRSFMTPTASVFNCRSWVDFPASLLCKLFEVSRSTRPHWKTNFIKTLVPQKPINALTQDSLFNVRASMSGHGRCVHVSAGTPQSPEEGVRSPGATGSWKLPNMSAGNWTWVLCQMCVPVACRGQKRALGLWKTGVTDGLEEHPVLSCALNLWAFSTAPPKLILKWHSHLPCICSLQQTSLTEDEL